MKDCGCNSFESLIAKMDDQTLPFSEKIINENLKLRIFDSSFPDHLFKWHWDEEDRFIVPESDTDWQFQFDDHLPQPITHEGIYIPRGVYHRLIKGSGKLKLYIHINMNH